MRLGKKFKQPSELKDYPVDFSDWLAEIAGGDTLASANAAVSCETNPSDTTLIVNKVVVSAMAAAIWLQGGTANQTYKVTLTTTTAGGRIDESELTVKVKEY